MTAPESSSSYLCHVVPVPQLDIATRRHPLATRTGIELFLSILEADRHWRPLTVRCRDALRTAYMRALRDALATGTNAVALPALPEGTHPATVRALHRRGLAADGRLTGLAVEVVRLAPAARERPVRTVRPNGALL